MYIDKLDDTVNEYNNTYHKTIKMKPIDVKNDAYIDSNKEVNNKDPKFQVGDHIRISKYQSIFAKGYTAIVMFAIDIENEIPSVSGLATNAALTAVENKIPDISSLVKKTDHNPKINEIKKKSY